MPTPTTRRAPLDLGILVVRLALGGVMIGHGIQKAFLNGIPGTQQGFAGMGAPLPELTGVLVTLLELGGGGRRTQVVHDDEVPLGTAESLDEVVVSRQVIQAGDGREAVELFRREAGRIAVAILDLLMPGLTHSRRSDWRHHCVVSATVLFCWIHVTAVPS